MSRYIDKEALLEWLEKVDGCIADGTVEAPTLYRQMITDIKNFGTEDVVAVVRCRDCKFATEYCHGDFECRCPHTPWASDEYAIPCNANDYCSYGERRENGT